LKHELKLVKPVFEIMNEQKEIFERHWEARSEAYEMLKEEDIQDVLVYTKKKLNELMDYLNTIKLNRKSKNCLFFYMEFVGILLRYHKSKFEMYPGTYMSLYIELLLGAQRYQNIKNELIELGCNIEEVGSIT
jgi:hypothetical protein